MTAASLEVRGVSAGYGPTRILEDVSFAVPAGGRLAILGRNGMGKTTLLATIAGQTRLYGGAIGLGDVEISGLDGSARALAGLGYVPQSRSVFKSLTVEENLFAGLKSRPKSATILGQPTILLLDEPLEGLAPVICDELMAAFTALASSKTMTILLVEQRIKAALEFAESVMVLERGRVAWSGTPVELEAQPETVDRLLGVGH